MCSWVPAGRSGAQVTAKCSDTIPSENTWTCYVAVVIKNALNLALSINQTFMSIRLRLGGKYIQGLYKRQNGLRNLLLCVMNKTAQR